MLFKKKKYEKKIINNIAYFYEIKPFNQLKDSLNYAGHDILYKKDGIIVFSKKHRETLYQVYLIDDFDKFYNLNLDNEIKNYNQEFKNGFEMDYLNLESKVIVICFKEKNERTIRYSQENSMSNNRLYKICLVYNEELLHLEEYVILPKVKRIYNEFLNLMLLDLDAVDLEEVE